MVFRCLKRLTAAFKTRTSNQGYDQSGPTWVRSSIDKGSLTNIMVFGDSNSFRPDGNEMCWPALLEEMAPEHFNVSNESCEGRTTKFDTGELNGLEVIARKLKSYAPLDYVIVMLGTNDLKSKYKATNASEIVHGMRLILAFIDELGSGAKPILLTPPPLGNVTSGELAGGQSRIPPLVVEYRLLAMNRDIRLVDIHKILDSSTDLQSDMIHLNAAGRKKVASAVWANLRDVILLQPVKS